MGVVEFRHSREEAKVLLIDGVEGSLLEPVGSQTSDPKSSYFTQVVTVARKNPPPL